jgi:DNA-directed RNA polymerase alpha subunit
MSDHRPDCADGTRHSGISGKRRHGEGVAENETEMSELDPTPELPDDTPIARVRLPIRIRNVLEAAGLKTIGEVRETADDTLLSSYDFSKGSVVPLREILGLPSCHGVRPARRG